MVKGVAEREQLPFQWVKEGSKGPITADFAFVRATSKQRAILPVGHSAWIGLMGREGTKAPLLPLMGDCSFIRAPSPSLAHC